MEDGKLEQIAASAKAIRGLRPEERFVIDLLRKRSRKPSLSRQLKRSVAVNLGRRAPGATPK
jgi:hypothetical protein